MQVNTFSIESPPPKSPFHKGPSAGRLTNHSEVWATRVVLQSYLTKVHFHFTLQSASFVRSISLTPGSAPLVFMKCGLSHPLALSRCYLVFAYL